MLLFLRRNLFSNYFMRWVVTRLPALSKTEAEALQAGDSWMEASLFRGKPDWQWLNKVELSQLSEEEKSFLENETTTLCEMINDWKIVNEEHDLSAEAWQYLKDKGFCGLTIKKEYGGKGFSAAAVSAIVQKISSRSFTAGVTAMVPNSLGLGELFSHFGTDEQKQKFLPDLASGKHLACFALTGPETGSDASSIPDVGIVCYAEFQGQRILGVKINFNKRYITLAPVATLVGLAFRLQDPDQLLNGIGQEGITCCYIPREHPGLQIGERHYPCGMPIMNGPLRGENIFVPLQWIIGGQIMAGKGWSILMSALSTGRAISLPAISQGITTTHYITSSAYAAIRAQFGQAIGDFEGVQAVLARIAGLTYMAEACRVLTYTAIDHGKKAAVASAITKYHATEIGRQVINDALDIHAGRGVMDGPKNYLTGHYRGLLISITGEGANIMTRNLIIYAQAMTRCHPYLSQLMQAATENNQINFDQALWKCIAYSMKNILRLGWLQLTKCLLVKNLPQNELKFYARQITFLSAAFAVMSDMTILVIGGELKKKERLAACLADMLSALYLSAAIIKYFSSHHLAKEELLHAKWALEYNLVQFQEGYLEVVSHFPNRFVAFILRMKAFPFGRKFKNPNHESEARLASAMQVSSKLREHFKNQFYMQDSNIALVEEAFMAQEKVKPIKEKLNHAIKDKKINRKAMIHNQLNEAKSLNILTQQEAENYLQFWEKYWQAIGVDAFASVEK